MLLRATTRDAKNPVQGKVKRNLSNNRGLPFHEAEIKVLRWPLIAIYSSLVGCKHEREPKNPPHWWACNTNNANALHKINQQAPQGFIYLFIFTPNSYNNGRKGIQTLAFLIIEIIRLSYKPSKSKSLISISCLNSSMSTSTQKEVCIIRKRKEKKKVTNHKDIKAQKTLTVQY